MQNVSIVTINTNVRRTEATQEQALISESDAPEILCSFLPKRIKWCSRESMNDTPLMDHSAILFELLDQQRLQSFSIARPQLLLEMTFGTLRSSRCR